MNDHVSPQISHPPRLFRLAEAAKRFFPEGGITVRSLRTEARAGRLQVIRIANKDFVTAAGIQAMLERCTCLVSDSRPAYISANAQDASPNGSSATERAKLARAAIQETLQAQKKR